MQISIPPVTPPITIPFVVFSEGKNLKMFFKILLAIILLQLVFFTGRF